MLFKKKLLLSTLALSGLVLSEVIVSGKNTYAMEDEFNKNENPSHIIEGSSLENSGLKHQQKAINSTLCNILPQWKWCSEEYQNSIKNTLHKIIVEDQEVAEKAMHALQCWINTCGWNEKICFYDLVSIIESLAEIAKNEKNLDVLLYKKYYNLPLLSYKNNWDTGEVSALLKAFEGVDSEKIYIFCIAIAQWYKCDHGIARNLIWALKDIENLTYEDLTRLLHPLRQWHDESRWYEERLTSKKSKFDSFDFARTLRSLGKVGLEKSFFLLDFIGKMRNEANWKSSTFGTTDFIEDFQSIDVKTMQTLCASLSPWIKGRQFTADTASALVKCLKAFDENKIVILCKELLPWVLKEKLIPTPFIEAIANIDNEKIPLFCRDLPKRYTWYENEIEFLDEVKNLDKDKFSALCLNFSKFFSTYRKDYFEILKELKNLEKNQIDTLTNILPYRFDNYSWVDSIIESIKDLNNIESSLAATMDYLLKGETVDYETLYEMLHQDFSRKKSIGNIFLGRALSEHLNKEMHEIKKSIYFVKQHEKNYLENSVTKQRRELIPLFVLSQEEVHSSKGQTALLSLPKALAEYVFGFLDMESMRELSLASKSFYVKLFPLMKKEKMISEESFGLLFPLVKGLYESGLTNSGFESALKIHSLEKFYNKHCRN